MGTIPTTRRLIPVLALLAGTVLLVSCGPGVTGTAAPGSAGPAASERTAPSEPAGTSDRPPSVSISTAPSTTAPGTSTPSTSTPSTSTAPPSVVVPSVSVPAIPDPTVPDPTVPDPTVPVPSVPVPSVSGPPQPEPPTVPGGEVDPAAYWAPAVDAYAWTSPSGNILCLLHPTEAVVGCAVFDHTLTPAEGCFADQPFVAELEAGEVVQGCTGDVPYSGEVLPYGSTIAVGPLTCTSDRAGMICDDGDLAFILSRDSLELAG